MMVMVFVPHVPTPPPSRRARELAKKVSDLVRLAAQGDPELSFPEIQQALRLVEVELRAEKGGFDQKKAVVLALIVSLLLGLAVLGFVFMQSGADLAVSPRLWLIIGGILAVGILAIVMAIARR